MLFDQGHVVEGTGSVYVGGYIKPSSDIAGNSFQTESSAMILASSPPTCSSTACSSFDPVMQAT